MGPQGLIGAHIDGLDRILARVAVADGDGIDALLVVLLAVPGGAVEADVLHKALGGLRHHGPPYLDVQIPRSGQIQVKAVGGGGGVAQLRAGGGIKGEDHAVAVAHGEAEEDPVILHPGEHIVVEHVQTGLVDGVIQCDLVIALLKQLHPDLRAGFQGREVVRIDHRLTGLVLVVRVPDDEGAPAEVRLGDAELHIPALFIPGDGQLAVAIETVDLLVQPEPEGHGVPGVFQKYGITGGHGVRSLGVAGHIKPAQAPAEMGIVAVDGIGAGVARVLRRVQGHVAHVIPQLLGPDGTNRPGQKDTRKGQCKDSSQCHKHHLLAHFYHMIP